MSRCLPVVEPGGPGSGSLGCADSRGVGASVFDKIIHEICFRRRRNPADYGKIVFAETGRGELAVQILCCFRCLCEYEESFHRLIEPVDDGKIGRPPLRNGFPRETGARSCKMILEDADQVRRADAAGLDGDSGGLVADDDLPVFIDDPGFHFPDSFPG